MNKSIVKRKASWKIIYHFVTNRPFSVFMLIVYTACILKVFPFGNTFYDCRNKMEPSKYEEICAKGTYSVGKIVKCEVMHEFSFFNRDPKVYTVEVNNDNGISYFQFSTIDEKSKYYNLDQGISVKTYNGESTVSELYPFHPSWLFLIGFYILFFLPSIWILLSIGIYLRRIKYILEISDIIPATIRHIKLTDGFFKHDRYKGFEIYVEFYNENGLRVIKGVDFKKSMLFRAYDVEEFNEKEIRIFYTSEYPDRFIPMFRFMVKEGFCDEDVSMTI